MTSKRLPRQGFLSTPGMIARLPFFYGWVVLGVAVLGRFISGPGQTFAISVFVDPILSDLALSRTQVSAIYTFSSITAGLCMGLVGYLLDRFGARILLTLAAFLLGLATIWMSRVVGETELFIGFTALRILGQGSLTLIPSTLIALWFVRLRGRAMAVGTLGVAAAQGVFPPLNYYLISQFGWRNAWVVLAGIVWITLLIPALLLVRPRPEAIGLMPDGDPHQPENLNSAQARESEFSLREALRTRSFWLLLFAGWSNPLIMTALTFHQISLLEGKGITAAAAAAVFGILAPLAVVGTFTSGFLTERFTNRYLATIGQLMLAATMAWSLTIDSRMDAFIYGGLLGFSSGFLMNTFSVIWPNYFGRKALGSIRGVATTSTVIAAALGPLPFGYLFDQTGDYSQAILLFMSLPVFCGLLSFFARKPSVPAPTQHPC